jgi:hypothetical protein
MPNHFKNSKGAPFCPRFPFCGCFTVAFVDVVDDPARIHSNRGRCGPWTAKYIIISIIATSAMAWRIRG